MAISGVLCQGAEIVLARRGIGAVSRSVEVARGFSVRCAFREVLDEFDGGLTMAIPMGNVCPRVRRFLDHFYHHPPFFEDVVQVTREANFRRRRSNFWYRDHATNQTSRVHFFQV